MYIRRHMAVREGVPVSDGSCSCTPYSSQPAAHPALAFTGDLAHSVTGSTPCARTAATKFSAAVTTTMRT